jgi:uncharacterized protein YcfJ
VNIRIAAPFLLILLAVPAFATDYTDSAPVVSSVPIYQTVSEPQQQCWTESVTRYEERRSPGGAILGGITGGILGNAIGRGNGRAATTVGGAIIGAVVGDHIANRDNRAVAVSRPVEHCQTVENYRQVLTGYQVTYYFNGRNTTVVLPYDPGPRVPVAVSVSNIVRPAYVGPSLARITYETRRDPWEQKHHKRPRPDRRWDR